MIKIANAPAKNNLLTRLIFNPSLSNCPKSGRIQKEHLKIPTDAAIADITDSALPEFILDSKRKHPFMTAEIFRTNLVSLAPVARASRSEPHAFDCLTLNGRGARIAELLSMQEMTKADSEASSREGARQTMQRSLRARNHVGESFVLLGWLERQKGGLLRFFESQSVAAEIIGGKCTAI